MNLAGNNWNLMTARSGSRSLSYSRSFSSSYQGLTGPSLAKAQKGFGLLTGLVSSLAPTVSLGKPNQNVFNSFNQLAKLALQNWQRNFRPIVNNVFNQAITGLANRGILDSSVASRVLANAQSSYLNNLANLSNTLERQAIEQAINYPITALGLLGRLAGVYGDLSRIAKSKSSSVRYSASEGSSYNPSPAVGFLSRLMGI